MKVIYFSVFVLSFSGSIVGAQSAKPESKPYPFRLINGHVYDFSALPAEPHTNYFIQGPIIQQLDGGVVVERSAGYAAVDTVPRNALTADSREMLKQISAQKFVEKYGPNFLQSNEARRFFWSQSPAMRSSIMDRVRPIKEYVHITDAHPISGEFSGYVIPTKPSKLVQSSGHLQTVKAFLVGRPIADFTTFTQMFKVFPHGIATIQVGTNRTPQPKK